MMVLSVLKAVFLASVAYQCDALAQSGIMSVSMDAASTMKASKSCALLDQRKFQFTDAVCGTMEYDVSSMLKAFNIEQAYWSQQGSQNPWWAVLTNQAKGAAIPVEKQLEFYASGVRSVNSMFPMAQKYGLLKADSIPKATALDFGCGLGRMSNALVAKGFEKVICVDQAKTFLDAAKQSLTSLAGQGAVAADVADKVEFVQSAPDLLCTVPPASVDFVHSIITLQHMKPMLQVAYIEQLCDVLREGGAGYFQIPTFIVANSDNHDQHCNLQSEVKTMMMHYTPIGEVTKHLNARGCNVLSSSELDMIGKGVGTSNLFIFQKSTSSFMRK